MRNIYKALVAIAGCTFAASVALGMPLHGGGFISNLIAATQVHTMGDSITAGSNASSTPNRYTNLYAAFEGYTLTNPAVSGQLACDMADTQVFTNENPGVTPNIRYTGMIGTNDANTKGTGSYEAVYNTCLQASLVWLGIPSTNKTFGNNCTKSGTWTVDTAYQPGGAQIAVFSQTNGNTLTCSITTTGGPIYILNRLHDGDGGTMTYAVDGGSTTTITTATTPVIATQNGGTHGVGLTRIAGILSGVHSVVFTVTSATSSSNNAEVVAVATPSAIVPCCTHVLEAGVPRQLNDNLASTTAAYNTDAFNDISQLAGDGVPVVFVDVRAFFNDTSDMSNTLHPNDTGMLHISQAFESVN